MSSKLFAICNENVQDFLSEMSHVKSRVIVKTEIKKCERKIRIRIRIINRNNLFRTTKYVLMIFVKKHRDIELVREFILHGKTLIYELYFKTKK